MLKILLLLCISISCINTLKISELARKTISPKYHQAWAQFKEKYYPGKGDDTECDDAKHMEQFEKNKEKVEEFEANKKKNNDTFNEECGKYCCFSSAEMTDREGLIVTKDEQALSRVLKIDKFRYLVHHLKDIPIKIMPKAK